MKKSLRYGIIGGVVIITAVLFWLLKGENTAAAPTVNTVKHISADWDKRYLWQSKDPYGLFIFNDLLKDRAPKDSLFSVSRSSQLDSLSGNEAIGTYLFLGQELGLYNEEIDTLLSLVEKGSDLIMITGNVTNNIAEGFTPPLEFIYDYAPTCKVRSGKDEFNMVYLYQNDTLAYPWRMIWHPGSYNSATEVISTISGHANFISFPVGKGSITIHSTPECFFNYQLSRRDGFRYADKMIQRIDPNKKLYYLEFARLKQREPVNIFDFKPDKKEGKRDDSYLQFLFQTPALRTALLLCILGIILYLLFRAKRTRPVVDVLPAKRNMSEIFVTTVASIYRNKENPYSVLLLHRKNFYNTIHKHYFIDLSKRTDNREIRNLATRCGVEEQEIHELLTRLDTEDKHMCTEEFLTETAKQKRAFYQKVGIISDKISQRLDEKELVLYRPALINFPFLLGGISLIIWGLYLLVNSKGIGIALWPVGTLILLWALRRLSRPTLKIQGKRITHYPSLGKIREFQVHEIIRAEKLSNGYVLHFSDAEKLVLPFSEFGNAERALFENYLLREKIIEL